MDRNIYKILKEAFMDVLNTEDDQIIDSTAIDVLKDSEEHTLQKINTLLNKQYNDEKIKYTLKVKRIEDALFIQTYDKEFNNFIDYKGKVRIQAAYRDDLQTIIDLAISIGIKYFGFTVEFFITGYHKIHTLDVNYIVDFQNITVLGLSMSHANIYNVIIDDKWFNENEYKRLPRSLSENNQCTLTCCFITESAIENAQYVNLYYCDNLKDFSFIHNVNDRCQIYFIDKHNFPKSGNLTGLPEGNYKLYITFGSDITYHSSTDVSDYIIDNKFNFIGIPETISSLKIIGRSETFKKGLLNNITFEGLTLNLVEKIEAIEFYVGADHTHTKIVMIGAKQLRLKQRNWKPTKKDLINVIKNKDYFLASYNDGDPAPEYIPPSESYNDSYISKQLKSNEAKQQKADDDAEDLEKMIELVHKYLKAGDSLYGYKVLYIKELGHNYIKVYYISRLSRFSTFKNYTLKSFINQMKQHNYRLNSDTGEFFNDLIVKPVEQRRKRILNQRKKKQQEEKIAQKLLKTQLQQEEKPVDIKKEKPKVIKKEKPVVKQQVSTTDNNDINVGMPGIEVIDYSERAYAIFGNTFQIKDELKDIGASYNPRLNYKGGKKPGWIIGKRKKDKLEQILNN